MANSFSMSVNILRDTDREFHYIPTPNAVNVVNQVVNDFKKGLRSFNIIGTYGTGKSSFLLALEQSIRGTQRYFEPHFTPIHPQVDFVKVVGSYDSIVEHFADLFNISANKNKSEYILSELYNRYHELKSEHRVLFILIDEFGKFLEYASRNKPEHELYFIQQLAELCNNPKYNIVLITTVHQSFESYAYALTSTQKQEWTKVKGRFREIPFNEPVEQLLFLASEYIDRNFEKKASKVKIEQCTTLALATKAFSVSHDFVRTIAPKIFPLDLLAANVLTLALQRYGQNERSLFSFLESTDYTSVAQFNKRVNPFYHLGCVYDYLHFNFYSFLISKYNPDFSSWSVLRSSLEEVERAFDTKIHDYAIAVKTIGLLNIFAASGAILDENFLCTYLSLSCGIENASTVIQNLQAKKIIRYRSHSKRFILFEGTDLDIQTALIEAGNKISEVGNVTTLLNKYFHFPPALAKLASYETGTPRFFEYIISEEPISRSPVGDIDGFVNLVFSDKLDVSDIKEASKQEHEAIIYCFFNNSSEIKYLLFEIEKIQRVIEENKDDRVAKRELEHISEAQKRLLQHYIMENIYSNSGSVQWFFNGEQKIIAHKKDFNKLLSQVCHTIYYATPTFHNELANRHKISSSIHTAKRNYFKALANHWDKENLGFDDSKFPPEKTIYLALLKKNGIVPFREHTLSMPSIHQESSFYDLWTVSEQFLESAKTEPRRIDEFVEILSRRPFKLKQGFIDFWVPTFLFLKRQDFALFGEYGYIPTLSDENLELIGKYPQHYTLKSFDIEGVKLDIFNQYRSFLNQSHELKFDNHSFIETIKPFIVFYKQLPEYSKKTKRLSPAAILIRQAIATSTNPEETFFETFPHALGVSLHALQEDSSLLQSYTISLQNAVRELRTSYDELVRRFEDFLCQEFIGTSLGFDEYKAYFQQRFSTLKKHLLLAHQKTFIQRIDSSLDDKKSWLASVAQAVVGKTLENFSDDDEILLYEKFKALIIDLDSLTTISKAGIDEGHEDVIGIKIDTFFSNINPKIVRVPKNKAKEIEQLKATLKKALGSDKTSNLAAVLNLLKELLQ